MRERRYYSYKSISPDRITPAYAGKTCCHCHSYRPPVDHPRVCGKDYLFKNSTEGHVGSPPRMRERQGYLLLNFGNHRITPAYAGKTGMGNKRIYLLQDHPRVCGKDKTFDPKAQDFVGSPPRMRERLFRAGKSLAARGITPAYAGKTSNLHLKFFLH